MPLEHDSRAHHPGAAAGTPVSDHAASATGPTIDVATVVALSRPETHADAGDLPQAQPSVPCPMAWPVLTMGPDRRANVVAMRTFLAIVLVLCLALDLGGVAQQQPERSLLERAGELGSPAFLGQVSLGAIFVLTGVLVTHDYLRSAPCTVWRRLLSQTAATVAVTLLPSLVLVFILRDVAAASTVLKVLGVVVPAWVLGSVVTAVVFHRHWAKARVTKIASVLLTVSMLTSFVVSSVLSRHAPSVGTTLWVDPDFSWAQSLMCTFQLSSYFFAGTLMVAFGDGMLRRRTLLRFLLPLIGVVVFLLALPMAMGGLDVGQPFLALALVPLTLVRLPAMVTGRDLWLGMVLHGWPIHLMLSSLGGHTLPPIATALVVCFTSAVLSLLSVRYVQRPLAKKLLAPHTVLPRTADQRSPIARWQGADTCDDAGELGLRSSTTRLLALAEPEKCARAAPHA